MRNRSTKVIITLGMLLLMISNILTATWVKKSTERQLLESQFSIAMHTANSYFDMYEQTGRYHDMALATSAWGTGVQIAFQFEDESRIFRERNVLNQVYHELQSGESEISTNDVSRVCKKLAEDPHDMTAYAELNEIFNLISH